MLRPAGLRQSAVKAKSPFRVSILRKRYYIIFVARQENGDLRKIPIPLHYAYIFVAAAVIGLFTVTGMAGSYSRMLLKTARFNQVRTERETIRHDYLQMEQVAHEKDVQAASLGSLASEVSALYGLRQNKLIKSSMRRVSATTGPAATASVISNTVNHWISFSHSVPRPCRARLRTGSTSRTIFRRLSAAS